MHRLAAIIAVTGALALLAGGDPAVAQRVCSALETQLLQLQAGGISRGEAARARMLRQRMARAGCASGVPSARSANVRSEPRRQPGIRGRTQPRAHALRRPEPSQGRRSAQSAPALPGETYRTMCVRQCDGYYFPVSFSTTGEHFGDDAETCARMCPEAEVGLYYHATGEAPEAMMSVAGEPYAELPAAFRYRERLDPDCGCGRPAVGEDAGGEAAEPRQPRLAALPLPRPAPAMDPETVANREGGFAVDAIEPAAFASPQGRFGRAVRQIGPRYGAATSELLLRPVSR